MVKLESLRVEAALDTSKYVEGARAKTAADKAMVDSAKGVDASVQQTERMLGQTKTAIDRLDIGLRTSTGNSLKFQEAQQRIQQAVETSRRTQEQGNEALAAAAARYGFIQNAAGQYVRATAAASQAAATHTGYVKLQSYQVANLGQQLQDVAVQLGSGQNPFIILLQQGPQITSAMGGVTNAIAGVTRFITPMTVAAAALAGSIALVSSRAGSLAAEGRESATALRAMGKDAETTTAQVRGLVESMRDLGVSRDTARSATLGAIRGVPTASAANLAAATRLAPDFAAGYAVSVEEATKKLAEMGAVGYTAIKRLDEAYGFLNADQAKQITLLAEQGKKAEALAIAYAALNNRVGGAARDSMSAAARAWTDIGRSWNDFVDAIANSAPVIAAVEKIAGALDSISRSLRGPTAAQREAIGTADLEAQIDQAERRLTEMKGIAARARDPNAEVNVPGVGYGAPAAFLSAAQAQAGYLRTQYQQRLGGIMDSPAFGGGAVPPGGGGAGGGGTGGGGAGGPGGERASDRKYIDEATNAYTRQLAVLSASAATRDIMRAKIAAEDEATNKGIEGKARDELITLRQKEARAQLATASGDALKAIESETVGLKDVAAAYALSLEAGNRAEASAQARAAALQNATVDEKKLAEAIRQRVAAQSLVDVTKQAKDLQFQAEASQKLVAASRQGAEASQEAQRQIEVETFARQALAKATDETREAVEREIAAYDAASKSRADAARQIARETELRRANQDVTIAAAEAQAATIADPTQRRAAEVAIARQQKINELTERYGTVAEGTGQQLLEMWNKATASREQVRFWEDVRARAQDVSRDISDFLVDGFVNAEKGGKSTFQNLWDGALAGAKRFAVRLAATMLEQRIILPITMQLIGGNAGMFGIAQPAGQSTSSIGGMNPLSFLSGGSGGGFNPLSMFSGGGGGGGGLSGIGDIFGGLFGSAAGSSTAAAATSTAVGPGGLLAGGGAASLATSTGATTGALSGAMAAIPVWGWIALAASTAKKFTQGAKPASAKGVANTLLMPSIEEWMANPMRSFGNVVDPVGTIIGDFAPKSPLRFLSPGGIFSGFRADAPHPYAGIGATLTPRGRVTTSTETTLDGMEIGAIKGTIQSIGSALSSLIQGIGGKLLSPVGLFAASGMDAGDFQLSATGHMIGGQNRGEVFGGDPEQATFGLFKALVGRGGVSGVSDLMKTGVRAARNTDELADNTEVISYFESLGTSAELAVRSLAKLNAEFVALSPRASALGIDFKAFEEDRLRQVQLIRDQLLPPTEAEATARAIADLNKHFDSLRDNASALGLDLGRIEEGRKLQLDAVSGTAVSGASLDSYLQSFSSLDALASGLGAGGSAGLSPQKQFDLLQQQFQDTRAVANDNRNPESIGAFTQAAGQLIDYTRNVFGQGQRFADVFDQVTRSARGLTVTLENDPVLQSLLRSTQSGNADIVAAISRLERKYDDLIAETRRANDIALQITKRAA